MEKTLGAVKEYLEKNYDEDELTSSVDEVISDYIDDGWEDDFDSEYDAYQEQGRGEAELQVTTGIYEEILKKLDMDYWDFEKKFGVTISSVIFEIYPDLDAG